MYPLTKPKLPSYLLNVLVLICAFSQPLKGAAFTQNTPVVSGSLASDEILTALFADEKDPPVVLSAFADDPAHSSITNEAKRFPKRWHNSAEALLALRPAIVILASWNNPALKSRVKQAKVPMIELQGFDSIDDVKTNIRIIGAAVQRLPQAETLIQQIDQALRDLAHTSAPKGKQPSILPYSASGTPGGEGTMIDAIIKASGARNTAADAGVKGWAKINGEILATLQPDFILLLTGPISGDEAKTAVKNDTIWKEMRAVKDSKFVYVPQASMYSVSHHIMSAAKQIHASLYPTLSPTGGK